MPSDSENLEGVADQALLLLTQMKRNPDVMPPYNVRFSCTDDSNIFHRTMLGGPYTVFRKKQ